MAQPVAIGIVMIYRDGRIVSFHALQTTVRVVIVDEFPLCPKRRLPERVNAAVSIHVVTGSEQIGFAVPATNSLNFINEKCPMVPQKDSGHIGPTD